MAHRREPTSPSRCSPSPSSRFTAGRLGTPRTARLTAAAGNGAAWNTPHSATHSRSREWGGLEHPAQRDSQPQPGMGRLGTPRTARLTAAAGNGAAWNTPHSATHSRSREWGGLEHPAQRDSQPQPGMGRLGTPRTARLTAAAGNGAAWNTPHSATHSAAGNGGGWNTPHSATHSRSREWGGLEHPAQRDSQPQPGMGRLSAAGVMGRWRQGGSASCRRSQVVLGDLAGFFGPTTLMMRLHTQVVGRPIRPRHACGAGLKFACLAASRSCAEVAHAEPGSHHAACGGQG